MNRQIRITSGDLIASAELNATGTADAIWNALPITASANTWGDEVYFSIPVKRGSEDGKDIVREGDLGYWPPGNAVCIFFGPTPASRGSEVRPASPVDVFGRILGDSKSFRSVKNGDVITLEKA